MGESHYIEFIVNHNRFFNSSSQWGIYQISLNKEFSFTTKHEIKTDFPYVGTLTGTVGKLEQNLIYEAQVKVIDSKYGLQFQAEYVKPKKINDKERLEAYLKTLVQWNIAEKIAAKYPNFIDMVMNEPLGHVKSLTMAIEGVGEKMAAKIINNIKTNFSLIDIMAMLSPLGVTQKMISKIINFHDNVNKVKEMLETNPYELTKIHGLGFKKVDEIALKLKPDIRISEFRIKAFISYLLKEEANNNGSTLMVRNILDAAVNKEMPECFNAYMEFLSTERVNQDLLRFVDNKVGLRKQEELESSIFNKLTYLDSVITYYQENNEKAIEKVLVDKKSLEIKEVDISEAIKYTNDKNGYELTPEQIDAVLNVVHNNVTIISGAAGTGKSSVIDCVLKVFKGRNVRMCALSAKAAQRMSEITGKNAVTIHRFLEYGPEGFARNETSPSDAEVLILDEASMVNAYLFNCLLAALPLGTKIVIVFDYAQLPPIGAGNIASDLLVSTFASTRFTKVHRQAEKSGILMDATRIRNGIAPVDFMATSNPGRITHGELQDMHYYFRSTKEEVNTLLINGFMSAMGRYGLDDVFIIVPRKTNVVNSTEMINYKIQDILIKEGNVEYVPKGKCQIREGARVIQRKNDYEKGVVNGEIGFIQNISFWAKTFEIKFGSEKIIEYQFDDISDIELAYALTVHSFQGSQAKVILIGLDTTHMIMLDAFLLYTAVTRAQKVCMMVSMPDAFKACIKNTKQKIRTTFLQNIIKQHLIDETPEIHSEEEFLDEISINDVVDIEIEEI